MRLIVLKVEAYFKTFGRFMICLVTSVSSCSRASITTSVGCDSTTVLVIIGFIWRIKSISSGQMSFFKTINNQIFFSNLKYSIQQIWGMHKFVAYGFPKDFSAPNHVLLLKTFPWYNFSKLLQMISLLFGWHNLDNSYLRVHTKSSERRRNSQPEKWGLSKYYS